MALGFWMNNKNCYGCKTCSIACKSNKQLNEGVLLRKVSCIRQDSPVDVSFLSMSCNHCEDPACVKACPVEAYTKLDSGIVKQDHDKCIGCRMCIAACPYTGVRSFNWQEPAYPMDFAVGDVDVPAHQKHVVEKCTFCYQRQARGEVPACMDLCPARARYWGDLDDPDSDVSKLIREREYMQLLPEKGTKPSTYYLV